MTDILSIPSEIALRGMPEDFTVDKSTCRIIRTPYTIGSKIILERKPTAM